MPTNPQKNRQIGDTAGFVLDGVTHFGTVVESTIFGVTIDSAELDFPHQVATVDALDEPEVVALKSSPLIEPVVHTLDADTQAALQRALRPIQESAEPIASFSELDSALIKAGYEPDIGYIQEKYGAHWKVKQGQPTILPPAPAALDLSPLIECFRQSMSDVSQANAAQISTLALSIAALSNKDSGRDESQNLLIAFLQEAKKPIEVTVKVDIPEQQVPVVNITNQVPAAQVVIASPLRSVAMVERDRHTQEILRTVTTHEFTTDEAQT